MSFDDELLEAFSAHLSRSLLMWRSAGLKPPEAFIALIQAAAEVLADAGHSDISNMIPEFSAELSAAHRRIVESRESKR